MTDLEAAPSIDAAPAAGAPGRPNPLPPGALVIGIGLAFQGLTTYAFVVIANHALAPKPYSAFSALWALTFVAAPASSSRWSRRWDGRRRRAGSPGSARGRWSGGRCCSAAASPSG